MLKLIDDQFLPTDYVQLYDQHQQCNQENRCIQDYMKDFNWLRTRTNIAQTEDQLIAHCVNKMREDIYV